MQKPSIIPDFFIVGAPKSGTTSLAHYLRDHSDIFISDPKEPHYFNTDFSDRQRRCKTPEEYIACFKGATGDQIIGEASVFYLFSEVAIPNILSVQQNAKFIVMVRNPVDMVRSLHLQNLVSGDEDRRDFSAAWELQKERSAGEDIPSGCRDQKVLQYGPVCKVGEQVARMLRNVDREQVHVIIFDDFIAHTQQVYIEVLNFLNVPYDGRTNFPKVKTARRIRSPFLHSVLKQLHICAYPIRVLFKVLGIHNAGAWVTRLRKWNAPPTQPSPISLVLATNLQNYFRDDVKQLEGILDRDLPWLDK